MGHVGFSLDSFLTDWVSRFSLDLVECFQEYVHDNLFQNTYFLQSVCSASLTFIFVNLVLFDGNEVGAKVFFILVSSVMYAVLPGKILKLSRMTLEYFLISHILGFVTLFPPQIMHVFGPQHTATINGLMKSISVSIPENMSIQIINKAMHR